MKKSNYLSWLIIFVFMFTMVFSTAPISYAATVLSDINGHWAESKIESLMVQGVVTGYPDNTFKPDNRVTRAEFITMANRAFSFAEKAAINYSDVTSADWYAPEIAKAKAAGYISGYEDGTIKPNNQISRQEVAVIIARILKLDGSKSLDKLTQFSDANQIAAWSRGAVAGMIEAGCMSGYPDRTFKAANPITRAEASAILYNAMNVDLSIEDGDKDKDLEEEEDLEEAVAKITADPEPGSVSYGTKVALNTETKGATIYFTLDESKPTNDSKKYTDKIRITEETTIKAIAVKDNMKDSEIFVGEYNVKSSGGGGSSSAPASGRVKMEIPPGGGTIRITPDSNAYIQPDVQTGTNNKVTATLPKLTIIDGTAEVEVPAGTQVTGPAGWDGSINLPIACATSSVSVPGAQKVEAVVEVGFYNKELTFDKAVKLIIPGQAGKAAGYVRNGKFTPITTDLDQNNQDYADTNLSAGEDGKIDVGGDLVIWTKHFTKFVAYTPISAAINPTTGTFDKKADAQADVETNITWGDATKVTAVKKGDVALTVYDHYTVDASKLTIKKGFLATQNVGNAALTIEFDKGDAATLTITVSDTTPAAVGSAAINPTTGVFDKKADAQADVKTNITWGDATKVTAVKKGDVALTVYDHYTVDVSKLTIKKGFLATQDVGNAALTIEFDKGDAATLTIIVSDTTPAPVESAAINPTTGTFDKKANAQADVETNITWGDATKVTAVKKGDVALTVYDHYTVDVSKLTIKKGFLATQDVGNAALTIEFDKGDAVTLTITVSDTTPPVPEGDLVDADAGADFTGVLYKKADGNLYYNQADSNGNWGIETQLGTGTEGRMAVDSSGKPHVVYTTSDKIGYRMFNGNTWTEAVLIQSKNGGKCSMPDIAVDGDGKAHITYTDTLGNTGDPTDEPDIMYVHNTTGSFAEENKIVIKNGYRNKDGKTGCSCNKGSYITLDTDQKYCVLFHYCFTDIIQTTYYVDIFYSANGVSHLGDRSKDVLDIFDFITREGKLYVLYKDEDNVKSVEIEGGNKWSRDAADITSAYSHDAAGNVVVIGGKNGNNLCVYYNNVSKTFNEIAVKGDAVSVIHLNGKFYAVYTDNSDSKIKMVEITKP